MAYVVYISMQVHLIESILVVHHFLDVFPTDLYGLPRKRDIDFSFELKKIKRPMSIPLYRMAPAENKDPSVQILDLLGKGLI